MADFTGTSGDDTQTGTASGEVFDYSQGGHDTLDGGDGNDEFDFGAAFDLGDSVNGGAGLDTLVLDGDYALALTATCFTSIETLRLLGAGHTYDLTLAANSVSGELFVHVNGRARVDGSAVTSGALEFQDHTAQAVTLIGGAGNDQFNLDLAPSRAAQFDGGDGLDTLLLATPVVGFHASGHSFRDIEVLQLLASAEMVFSDGNVAAGATMKVFSIGLPTDVFDLDAHKETDGRYVMRANDAADTLTGGHRDDTLRGGGGDDVLTGGADGDRLHGGGGQDVYVYGAVADSRPGAADIINGLATNDVIDLSRIDADTTQAGVQHFTLVAEFTGHAGELALTYVAEDDTTRIIGDVDGDGAADLLIKVTGDQTDFTGFLLGAGT